MLLLGLLLATLVAVAHCTFIPGGNCGGCPGVCIDNGGVCVSQGGTCVCTTHTRECDLQTHYGPKTGCEFKVSCVASNGWCGPDCYGVDTESKKKTGKCTHCYYGHYGKDCQFYHNCNTENGVCTDKSCYGINGNGNCDKCKNGYRGTNCEINCDKTKGICTGSCLLGNGNTCSDCQPGYFGTNCQGIVSCDPLYGICEPGTCSGVTGNGLCTRCKTTEEIGCGLDKHPPATCHDSYKRLRLRHSPKCNKEVNCDYYHGSCELNGPRKCQGVEGNGECSSCELYRYNPYCSERAKCNRDNGTCEKGTCWGEMVPARQSKCTTCNTGWTGDQCDIPVLCELQNGICLEGECRGVGGNGRCSSCLPGFFGDYCTEEETCIVKNSVGGPDSTTGTCKACKPGYFGENCEFRVTCSTLPAGVCNEGTCYGVAGSGQCSACNAGYYGVNCENVATCSSNGECDCTPFGTGKCRSCKEGFTGENCDVSVDGQSSTDNGFVSFLEQRTARFGVAAASGVAVALMLIVAHVVRSNT